MIEQGTPEWHAMRCGKVTASRIKDVLDFTSKGASGAKREAYKLELLAELLTHEPAETFANAAMRWGTDTEPLARAAYEVESGVMVDQVAFAAHPTMDFAGASPDGLIGDEGLVEIKCPTSSTFIKWKLAGGVPPEHRAQVVWQMACTGRAWCDFYAYDPRLPEGMNSMLVRVNRDQAEIADLETKVRAFWGEVLAMWDQLEAAS